MNILLKWYIIMGISLAIERSSVIFSNREETRDCYDASQCAPLSALEASTRPALRQTPVANDMIFAHHNTLSSIIHIGNKSLIANNEWPVEKLYKTNTEFVGHYWWLKIFLFVTQCTKMGSFIRHVWIQKTSFPMVDITACHKMLLIFDNVTNSAQPEIS